MADDRWERVYEILRAALDRQGAFRDSFIDMACAGDAELRAEVVALLDAEQSDAGVVHSTSTIPFSDTNRPNARVRATREQELPSGSESHRLAIPRRCLVCGARYDSRRRLCDADGAVLDDDLDALIGTTFDGRYRVESVLGRGGMGVVLRARDETLNDTVALKLLDDRYASEPRALRRFVREGQIARRFSHPAVVGIHDLVCGDTGPVYLVLEFVDGQTLSAVLRQRRQLSPSEVVTFLRPIAEALDAAHARGVIHRDLKPENIMVRDVTAEPRTKLLDLGIAIMHETADNGAETRLTKQGQWIGTPIYMSPEQWAAPLDGSGLDGRCDVYALGVVVHHLVSGAPPFAGDIGTLRSLHLEGRPRRLDSAIAGVARAFADAVVRAMSKDRSDRYVKAGVFVAELEKALAGQNTTVAGPLSGDAAVTLGPSSGMRAPTDAVDAASTGEFDRIPGNLPAQATSFIATAGVVDAVVAVFDDARCVTLTGPGGIGKTRLSLEVAARVPGRFPDGTWFVELAAITDQRLVLRTVADALGAREHPGEPLEKSVHERIGDARLLIVMDNCEHVIDAAAALTADLLRACPRVSVLATSREALAIPGETLFAVAPLDAPAVDEREDALRRSPAIQLFLDRARSAAPAFAPIGDDFTMIGAICRRLDGLPLAIELAAARVRTLGLGEVLARLDDRFRLLAASERGRTSRQRTLHAAIDWSFQMLSEAERALLGRVAVFASGATLETIELVCPDPDGPDTVDSLVVRRDAITDLVESLVAKSLVVADLERVPVRYRMFESIRAFAIESLGTSGARETIEGRVDDWVIAMARVCGSVYGTSTRRVEEMKVLAEFDTVRQSFERLSRRGDGGNGLATAAAWLGAFFESHGLLSEGRAWLGTAISMGSKQEFRSLALSWSGRLAIGQGDYEGASASLEVALADARESNDQPATARVLRSLAYLAMRRRDEATALARAAEAEALYRTLGIETGEASAAHIMALVAMGRGDYAAARPLLERSVEINRRRAEDRDLAISSYGLGKVMGELGEFDAADRLIAEAIAIAERMEDTQTLAYALDAMGSVALERGDSGAALAVFRRALELAQSVGDDSLSVDLVTAIASALSAVGVANAAVVLATAAAARRRRAGLPLSDHELAVFEGRLAPSRSSLTPEVLAAAEARGSTMTFDEAVTEALGPAVA